MPLVPGLALVLLGGQPPVRARSLRVHEGADHRSVEGRLIALEREHIVSALLDDLGRDRALTAHGINGNHTALQREQAQQARERRDLVRLGVGGLLAEHQAAGRRPRAEQVQRVLAAGASARAAGGLAIEGDDLRRQLAHDCLHPRQKTAPELRGGEPREHAPKRIVRGNAAGQGQEGTQPRFLGPPERLHRHPIVGPTDHRA
jgi:hypothetical protein